jgi:hypothetical protein
MDCALEAVEYVPVTGSDYLETQRIVVTTNFADCHACETDPAKVGRHITVKSAREDKIRIVFDPYAHSSSLAVGCRVDIRYFPVDAFGSRGRPILVANHNGFQSAG